MISVSLDEVEIVDTPGVGAKDGQEDVAKAMAEIPGADLVLWVADNDSFQRDTAQALREVAFRGKPIVVALNCRARLVDDDDRDDFLADPDAVYAQHEGHFHMIRSHLSAAAVHPIAEVTLHAEAARQARTDDAFGRALRDVSHIGSLLAVLEHESREHRTARRVLRAADEVRNQAERLGDALATLEQRTRETIDIGRRTRKDQERRVGHLIDACQQRMQDDVIRIVGARQSWPQTVADFGPQVADQWDAEQAALVAEVDQALKERLADLARAVKGAAIAAEREWTTAHPELEIEGLRDFRGLWKRKAAGVAVGAGGALAFALPGLLIAGPVGAIVGAVAGLVGQALVPRLRKKIQSLFKSRVTILEANRVLLRTEIGKILTELEARTLADVTRSVAAIRDATASTFALRAESEQASSSAADLLANQRGAVRSEISTLDLETARCILRADGRPRIAESIERVSRLPGICAAVELSSDSLAEAWLFPPTSPEIMTFGQESDPRLPGARASTYVLGLTEEVPAFLQCRFDRTVVTVDTAIPNQVLAAWSANLSDHLGTIVEMVSTQRSADA